MSLVAVKDYTDPAQLLADAAARHERLYGPKVRPVDLGAAARPVAAPIIADPDDEPKRWTVHETEKLRGLFALGKRVRDIASELDRTEKSVSRRLARIGLRRKTVRRPGSDAAGRDWLNLQFDRVQARPANAPMVLRVVSDMTGVPLSDILGARRHLHAVTARHIAYFMMRRHTQLSSIRIAAACGRMDHTTVLHGINSVSRRLDANTDFAGLLYDITTEINERARKRGAEVSP
jgi:chromosomal replication initiator protein